MKIAEPKACTNCRGTGMWKAWPEDPDQPCYVCGGSGQQPPHRECSIWDDEHCGAEDCPAARASRERRRASSEGAWSPLILHNEGAAGWRHYLDGKPVSCGTSLRLQSFELRSDDWGDYDAVGKGEADVCYEAQLSGRREDVRVTLLTGVAGRTAYLEYSDSMRFRWPERNRW